MTKYSVVWDQEYARNCHDEYLTKPLSKEEAFAFAKNWAERKVRSAFPALERSDNPEQYDMLIKAKMHELSYIPTEIEERKNEPTD